MNFHNFIPVSMVDYPGHPASILFTSGCNFACPYCHNAEIILPRDNDLVSGEKVLTMLSTVQDFTKHIVISGGEPTIHPELVDFCKMLKDRGLCVKLDTNGTNPKMLGDLVPFVDYVALDIKTTKDKYTRFVSDSGNLSTSVGVLVERSLELLLDNYGDDSFEIRSTAVAPWITKKEIHVLMDDWYGLLSGTDVKLYIQKATISDDVLVPKLYKSDVTKHTHYPLSSCEVNEIVDVCVSHGVNAIPRNV